MRYASFCGRVHVRDQFHAHQLFNSLISRHETHIQTIAFAQLDASCQMQLEFMCQLR
jgi:hypothetical protein